MTQTCNFLSYPPPAAIPSSSSPPLRHLFPSPNPFLFPPPLLSTTHPLTPPTITPCPHLKLFGALKQPLVLLDEAANLRVIPGRLIRGSLQLAVRILQICLAREEKERSYGRQSRGWSFIGPAAWLRPSSNIRQMAQAAGKQLNRGFPTLRIPRINRFTWAIPWTRDASEASR